MSDLVTISTRIPPAMNAMLMKIAREFNLSKSDIIRLAVSDFFKGKRIVGVSELPGPSDGSEYTPVPVLIVEKQPDGD